MNFKIDTYIMYIHAANSGSVSEDTLVQAIVVGIVGVVVISFLLISIILIIVFCCHKKKSG